MRKFSIVDDSNQHRAAVLAVFPVFWKQEVIGTPLAFLREYQKTKGDEMKLRRFFAEECAATSVEYAIILALIVFACMSAIQFVGNATAGHWNESAKQVSSALK